VKVWEKELRLSENVRERPFTFDVEDVEEGPITFKTRDAQHVAMESQRE